MNAIKCSIPCLHFPRFRTSLTLIALVLLLAGAGLFGTLATFHFRRQAHPLIDFRSLRIPSYLVTLRGGSLFRMAISAVPFLLPLLFQIGFGLSPFASGLLVLSVFAGNLVMKSLTTPILRRFPFRTTMLVNGTLNAATLFGCALLTPATPFFAALFRRPPGLALTRLRRN